MYLRKLPKDFLFSFEMFFLKLKPVEFCSKKVETDGDVTLLAQPYQRRIIMVVIN